MIMYDKLKNSLRKYGLQALVLGGLTLGVSGCSNKDYISENKILEKKEQQNKGNSNIYLYLMMMAGGTASIVSYRNSKK